MTATRSPRRVAAVIRQRIHAAGERLWRYEDFGDLPFSAVAQTLSRLARAGEIQRLSKGLYYRARETAFGASRPNPTEIRTLAAARTPLFPAGISAANLLGFTTQQPHRTEVSTAAPSVPRKLVGGDVIVHTRRPAAWAKLSESDAALLDFLRSGGTTSELTSEQTVRRLLSLCREDGRYERLLAVAATEPPRVRAILGAIGEQLRKQQSVVQPLRASLNPLSKFDFGALATLASASRWQAKEQRRA